jgi:hypothetical protein
MIYVISEKIRKKKPGGSTIRPSCPWLYDPCYYIYIKFSIDIEYIISMVPTVRKESGSGNEVGGAAAS